MMFVIGSDSQLTPTLFNRKAERQTMPEGIKIKPACHPATNINVNSSVVAATAWDSK